MSKHTPGPWEIGAEYMVCKLDELNVGSNHIQSKNDPESEEADAKLIAAAPDLYAALMMVLDDPESLAGRPRTAEAVNAALEKAKGEQG